MQGSAIGNGWVDPLIQYGAYGEFAYAFYRLFISYNVSRYQNGLINEAVYEASNAELAVCKGFIETGVWPLAIDACNIMLETILVAAGNINVRQAIQLNPITFNQVYDIRKQCTYPPLCYDFSLLDKWIAVCFLLKLVFLLLSVTSSKTSIRSYIRLDRLQYGSSHFVAWRLDFEFGC